MTAQKSIARINLPAPRPPPNDGPIRGTGALIGDRLVLTALHVVADRTQDPPDWYGGPITLTFDGATESIEAEIEPEQWSRVDDWVLLRCKKDPGVKPLPIHEFDGDDVGRPWRTYGFPQMKSDGMTFEGTITALDAPYEEARAIQLRGLQLGDGQGVRADGLSGAPCIVEGAVVGVIRAAPKKDGLVEGGTAYACPMGPILDRAGKLLWQIDPYRGLPGLEHRDLPSEPYRGLKHYAVKDAATFFGRGRALRALYEMMTEPDRNPIVLLHGQSGVGKSSLLDAGLRARLELSSVVQYSRRDGSKDLKTCFEEAIEKDWLALEENKKKPVVVILDQVEEVFTRARDESDAELAEFLDVLAPLFADGARRPKGRILLSFRKEWLSEIRECLKLRDLPFNEYYLGRLDAKGIAEVVHGLTRTRRLRDHYRATVTSGLGDIIARDLHESDKKSPIAPTLQLVMTHLWSRAKVATPTEPVLTQDIYGALKEEGIHLEEFVRSAIAKMALREVWWKRSGVPLVLAPAELPAIPA